MSQIQNRFKVGYLDIGHRVCISVNFVFISSISLAGGEFKMLNFQVACAQKWNVVINL